MKTYRLYTGSDGQSHIEPIDLAKTPEWAKGLPTTQISFREDPVGRFIDWHPAPPVRDHPLRPARDRPRRRLEAHLRARRRTAGRGHDGQGAHHSRPRQSALPDRDGAAGAAMKKILLSPKQSEAVLEIA